MAMLELVVVATVNPNLEAKDRMKPRGMKQFLPPGLKDDKPKKRPSLKKQLQALARAFGGKYGDDNQ